MCWHRVCRSKGLWPRYHTSQSALIPNITYRVSLSHRVVPASANSHTHTHTCIGIPFVSTWLGFCSIHKNTIPVYLIDCQTSPAVFARKCAGAFRLCQISHALWTAGLSCDISVLYCCPGHRPWWRVWSTHKQPRFVRRIGDRSLTGLLFKHSGDLWPHLSPWPLASFYFSFLRVSPA